MKTVLRIFVIVLANLITLPFQILILIGIYASNLREDELDELSEWGSEILHSNITWIKTGRFPED